MTERTLQSPRSLREEVAQTLRPLVGADDVVFFTYVEIDGTNHYSSFTGACSDDMQQHITGMEGLASFSNVHWDPVLLPRQERDCFQPGQYLVAPGWEEDALERAFYAPMEVTQQCRAILYDGHSLLGWVGCLRRGRGAAPFSAEEQRLLDRRIPEIKARLLAAARLDEEQVSGGHGVFDRGCRRLQWVSAGARAWFTRERLEHLRWAVAQDPSPPFVVIDQRVVHLCRLEGEDGGRVMVTLERGEEPRLDPRADLTPAQRDVADLAVVGATNAEIARHLDISPETVRTHMRNLYRRLDVASRVDLCRKLGVG